MLEYKGFSLKQDGTMGYWLIKQQGSGAVPETLRGLYTTPSIAKKAIDAYKPKRGAKKKDGETNTAV